AATATAGAFELHERDGAYVLVGGLAPTRSPAQVRTRRQRLILAGALVVAATIAGAVIIATRQTVVTVPPNSVGIIDPKTNKVVGHVLVGSRPGAVAVGSNGVWVANLDDKTLSRIDPKTRKVVHTIPLDATPTDVAVGPGDVWVAYGYSGALARVTPEYNSVRKQTYFPIN